MRELQSLLKKREITFNPVDSRVRCFAHVINICSSHIIASAIPSSSATNPFSLTPSVSDGGRTSFDISDDALDQSVCDDSDDEDSDYDPMLDYNGPEAEDPYDGKNNAKFREWSAGLKSDPLGRARKVISSIRSSDQRRIRFSISIDEGNISGWFPKRDSQRKRIPGQTVQVKNRQLLRDVKTRWDSVFLMLERLRSLRPVSCLTDRTPVTS